MFFKLAKPGLMKAFEGKWTIKGCDPAQPLSALMDARDQRGHGVHPAEPQQLQLQGFNSLSAQWTKGATSFANNLRGASATTGCRTLWQHLVRCYAAKHEQCIAVACRLSCSACSGREVTQPVLGCILDSTQGSTCPGPDHRHSPTHPACPLYPDIVTTADMDPDPAHGPGPSPSLDPHAKASNKYAPLLERSCTQGGCHGRRGRQRC